jgi:aromatase
MKTEHTIEVACHPDDAFALCLGVDRWPDVFPPCLDAVVLELTDRRQTIRLTAKANGHIFSWESKRRLDRAARTIEFSQSTPSPLVAYMNGHWAVQAAEGGCRVMLVHEFAVKEVVAGLVNGVTTPDEAMSFMLRTIEDNSTKELAAFKAALERDQRMHEFSESLVITGAHKRVAYRLLADLRGWPWLLPHCDAIEVFYDDGRYQEFCMQVRVADRTEKIRSMRILGDDCIDYFQPEPPPALEEHRGRWTVTDTEEGVEIVAWHSIVLARDYWADTSLDEAKRKVEAAINANSMGTMKAIMSKLGETNS